MGSIAYLRRRYGARAGLQLLRALSWRWNSARVPFPDRLLQRWRPAHLLQPGCNELDAFGGRKTAGSDNKTAAGPLVRLGSLREAGAKAGSGRGRWVAGEEGECGSEWETAGIDLWLSSARRELEVAASLSRTGDSSCYRFLLQRPGMPSPCRAVHISRECAAGPDLYPPDQHAG